MKTTLKLVIPTFLFFILSSFLFNNNLRYDSHSLAGKDINDSLVTDFCKEAGRIRVIKGYLQTCESEKKYIEASLHNNINRIKDLNYCVKTGVIQTNIKSVDSLKALEFNYYIIYSYGMSSDINTYKIRLSNKDYEMSSPMTKASYTNYHFVINNKVIILSHYGIKSYFPPYDINKYINYFEEQLK